MYSIEEIRPNQYSIDPIVYGLMVRKCLYNSKQYPSIGGT